MAFSVNVDYIGKLCTVKGVSGFGVILGHQTIAGVGGPWHRFEVWFPTDDLPREGWGDDVQIVREAGEMDLLYARSQRQMYNERYRPARGNE